MANNQVLLLAAAGASTRMGRDKMTLPLPGGPMPLQIIDKCLQADINSIVVVISPNQNRSGGLKELLLVRFCHLPHLSLSIITNPHPEQGMLSSLRMGVNQLPRSIEGVWIHPADLPLVTVETYQQLKTFCQGLGKDRTQRLIAPLFKGQKGHPVFFGAKYFPSFFQAPLQVGARWITKKYRDSLDLVEVDDQGILQDMDRPKDIEQYFSSP